MNDKRNLQMAEIEIRLKDILVECAKSMKLIVVLTVLCSLIFIGIGVISESQSESMETRYSYEEACQLLEKTEIKTVEELVLMTEQKEALNEYIEKSEKMKMDCYSVPVSVVEIHLDVDSKESEIDALTLYQDYILKGGLAQDIALETEDVQYIRELLTGSDSTRVGNEELATNFWVQVVASSEEKRDDITSRVMVQLNDYREVVKNIVGEHSLIIVNETKSIIVDESLKDFQDTKKKNLETLVLKVNEGKESLTDLQLFVYNHMLEKHNADYIIEKTDISYVKYVIIGVALGIVIAIFIIIVRFIFDKTIKNDVEVQNMYGLRNFGLLYSKNSSKYNQCLDQVIYGKKLKQSDALLYANINNGIKENNDTVAIVGQYSVSEIESFLNGLKENKRMFAPVGNILSESNALLEIAKYRKAILMIKEREVTYSELYQLLLLCEQDGIEVLGYITII